MDAQTGAVGARGTAAHAEGDVADLGLVHRDRLEHAEERRRAAEIGEQVEVEAAAADCPDDAADLLLGVLGAQLRGELLEPLRDRLVEVLLQVDELGHHHHDAVAVAEILDEAALVHDVPRILGLLVGGDRNDLWTSGKW